MCIRDRCSRVRTQHPVAGTRHSEERRARFEVILRANSDPGMARAGQRANEYLADQVRANAERAPVPAPGSSP
eukprot:12140641-Alexandrium_andersonii.AAC.1